MRNWIVALLIFGLAATAAAAPLTVNVNEKNLEAVLTLPTAAARAVLKDLQLTVEDRRGDDYRLLASAAEVAWLTAHGYRVKVLSRVEPAEKATGYRTYPEVVAELQTIAQQYPDLAKRFEIGQSAGGKTMYALKISDNVAADEAEPAVLFDAAIHGDESIGTCVAFGFIYELLENYDSDATIADLVDENEIWVVPAVNPDGLNLMRGNANGVDMNRNYPSFWEGYTKWSGQPETRAIMELARDIRPVLSVSYHGGAEVINYTWDGIYTRSPENDLEIAISQVYQQESSYDITNGADWYIADGTTEDWYHATNGTLSVIVEISNVKMPAAGNIQTYIDRNVPAMLDWTAQTARLVRGTVTSAADGLPLEATIIADQRLAVTSDPDLGDYYRLLPAGAHTLHVWANGFGWTDVPVTATAGGAQKDIELEPAADGVNAAIRCVLNLRKDAADNPANVSLPTAALGGNDGAAFSLGVGGYAAFDMGENTPVRDGEGADLKIYEKGNDEGYTVMAAAQWTGPWQSLGTGTGTQEFDLSGSGLSEARFILLTDDGDGSNTTADPGADIDAIEAYPVCDAPAADFTATPLQGDAPLIVDFQGLVSADQGCLSAVTWDFGDGGSSAETSPTHTYTQPGVYTVTLTASGPGGDDQEIKADFITVSGGTDDDDSADDDAADDDATDDDNDSGDDDDDNDSGGCGC
ncbi:MAG: PKD domain-containing protein [Myxococcales bacterium]|nr:PKD domain-containing protein [Myxococcales bacterium]